ncbi:MAG: hypothetical protein OER88_14770, partial [Planctomycetota bacterium]|nr:hypothetical protein [Planctomycetota bacterium]
AARNRVYVYGHHSLSYHPLTVGQPPAGVSLPPTLSFAFPDQMKPVQGAVRADGLAVAYISRTPTHRKDKRRFVLSVADHIKRLVVRRSLRGDPFDIRWVDKNRVLITATDRETMLVYQLWVSENHLRTRQLSAAYLAPPEIVPARWIPPESKG